MSRKATSRRISHTRKLASAKRRIRRHNLLASRESLEQLSNGIIEMGLKVDSTLIGLFYVKIQFNDLVIIESITNRS
jgi:hypothetical protein